MSTAVRAKRNLGDTEDHVRELRRRVDEAKEQGERMAAEAKARADAAEKQRAEEEIARVNSAAARAERRIKLQAEAAALKEELKRTNEANAKNMHRDGLEHGVLYNLNDELNALVADNRRRMAVVDYLQDLRAVQDVAKKAAQLSYGWIEPTKTGDPFDTVYVLCYDGYVPEEEWGGESDDEDFSGGGDFSVYVGINGRGKMVFEDTTNDWLKLSREHTKLGYIELQSS